MKKYNIVKSLTKDYLHGKLEKFTIDYINSEELKVYVEYLDDYRFRFDYDLIVNINDKTTTFLSHHGTQVCDKINLSRDRQFELALTKAFLG